MTRLAKCKIYCSEHCQNEDLKKEEREKVLLERLNKVQEDCLEKDAFVERLRKHSQDFQDEAMSVEERYVGEIACHKRRTASLNKEMEELKVRNDEWQIKFGEGEQLILRLERDVAELNAVNGCMIGAIRTLEEENKMYARELEMVKGKAAEMESGLAGRCKADEGEDAECVDVVSGPKVVAVEASVVLEAEDGCVPSKTVRNRVLILCDESGRRLNEVLNKCLKDRNVKVELFRKPGAWFSGVVEDIQALTKDYTLDDHVLIMAGVNDFRNGRYPLFKTINDKIVRSCSNTNVLLASVPNVTSVRLNRRICRFNTKLREYSSRINAYTQGKFEFLDVTSSGGAKLSKRVVAGRAADIVCKKVHSGNLIFININDAESKNMQPENNSESETHHETDGDLGESFLILVQGPPDRA